MAGRESASPSVLLVDDEVDILVSLEALIRAEMPGVRVRTATRADQALDVVRREAIDLIITDYRMPGMDGVALLERARALRPGVAAVVMTAYPDPEVAVRATRDAGAGLVIAKPFDLPTFVEAVRGLLFPPPAQASWLAAPQGASSPAGP